MKKLIISKLFLLLLSSSLLAQNCFIPEASGIVKVNNKLYIVSDDTVGKYYTYSLNGLNLSNRLLLNDCSRLDSIDLRFGKIKLDLEGISTIGNNVVVVSERNRSLILVDSILKTYSERFTEFANRGIEGLDIKTLDQSRGKYDIVAIWEGGYPVQQDITIALEYKKNNKSMPPFIIKYTTISNKIIKPSKRIIKLDMRKINKMIDRKSKNYGEPYANRFRAPDLVWYKDGFIVLLSSERSIPRKNKKEYKYKLLQRFDINGVPIGDPLDLKQVMGNDISFNWEGLGWFIQDDSLILIHDSKKENKNTSIQIVKIPNSWK